jgi:hypothetical protein
MVEGFDQEGPGAGPEGEAAADLPDDRADLHAVAGFQVFRRRPATREADARLAEEALDAAAESAHEAVPSRAGSGSAGGRIRASRSSTASDTASASKRRRRSSPESWSSSF